MLTTGNVLCGVRSFRGINTWPAVARVANSRTNEKRLRANNAIHFAVRHHRATTKLDICPQNAQYEFRHAEILFFYFQNIAPHKRV
jgi:hypothetical protein